MCCFRSRLVFNLLLRHLTFHKVAYRCITAIGVGLRIEPNFHTLYVRAYSHYMFCKFHWINWHGSADSSLNFKVHFSSEQAVAYWIFTNNKSNFCIALRQQLKCFNNECQVPIAHSVFKQTVLNVSAHQLKQYTIEICCKMIHYCLINELVKRLIPSRLQNGLLARYDHASPMAWQL